MSEDIDLKMVERQKGTSSKPNRTALTNQLITSLEKSAAFDVINTHFQDQRRVQILYIEYPKHFQSSILRPTLQLELVEKTLYQPTRQLSVSSLYAETLKLPTEIHELECVNMESILVEKIISLLWRTAALKEKISIKDDCALIRHLYDVHILSKHKQNDINHELLRHIIRKVIEDDTKRYQTKYPAFYHAPKKTLELGLNDILSNEKHQSRYELFLLPLLYTTQAPSWEEALDSFEKMAHNILKLL